MSSIDTSGPEFKGIKAKLQNCIEEYISLCNKEYNTQYMPTHWVLMVEGILMDDPEYSMVIREPSQPPPSHTKQLGLLRYGIIRLEREIAADDEDD